MTDTPEKIDVAKPEAGEAGPGPETSSAIVPRADTAPAATSDNPPAVTDANAALPPAPPAPPADPPAPASPPPPPPPSGEAGDMKEAPLLEHLAELRTRLVRCLIAVAVGFAACYAFADKLLVVLLKPLTDVLPKGSTLIATTLPEKFFTVMKLALVAGAFVVSPYIFYQLWKFVAPGLYKEERRHIIPVAIATAVCFVGGSLFGYFVVFPFGFRFFVDYAAEYITIMPTISAYFSLAVTLLFAFGIIFELPVFIFFLTSLGLVTTKALRKFRRWAILLIFIVAAILTPTPDAVNQLLMAGPMCILYEVGIWVSWFVDRSRKEEKARREAAAKQPPADTPPPAGPETPAGEETPPADDQASRAG